jgi:hypothetical protein
LKKLQGKARQISAIRVHTHNERFAPYDGRCLGLSEQVKDHVFNPYEFYFDVCFDLVLRTAWNRAKKFLRKGCQYDRCACPDSAAEWQTRVYLL